MEYLDEWTENQTQFLIRISRFDTICVMFDLVQDLTTSLQKFVPNLILYLLDLGKYGISH